MSGSAMLWLPILLPLAAGCLVLPLRKGAFRLVEAVTGLATAANLIVAIILFKREAELSVPWAGYGLSFSLRLYQFSGFILLAAAGFSLLISLYCWKFMRERERLNQFYAYLLITLGMVNGAVLADHLIVLLFFWEGLLLTLFGMIAIGSPGAFKTAFKAFVIVGVTDVCMMLGIALAGKAAGTLVMSKIHLPLDAIGCAAMLLMMIGAVSKAGAMPFHSWIPDAAVDAPLPFMAFLPASLEKLLGIYLLARISLDLFKLTPHAWVSPLMMILGSVTILLAVMMALVQTDYKKLLSYHAISQVGYMILGIGTAVPAGIVGGLFHMINHAMYKSGLFLTAGAVERQTGTTDLNKLGSLAPRMPVTFACFIVTAASISGVPPFNGFFSKELVYEGALERSAVFYLAAVLGSFFTAASFLKLGHAAYMDKRNPANAGTKEAPVSMLVPMIVIAGFCVLFGVNNALPLHHLIQPILGASRLEGRDFAGMPHSVLLVVVTLTILAAAVINHVLGARTAGSGLGAADHIHHARGLKGIYAGAGRGVFDPYGWGMRAAALLAGLLWRVDRIVDWVSDTCATEATRIFSAGIRSVHNGDIARYVLWALVGSAAIIVFLLKSG